MKVSLEDLNKLADEYVEKCNAAEEALDAYNDIKKRLTDAIKLADEETLKAYFDQK